MEEESPPQIFTIGHGAQDFGRFLARCEAHGVTTVVDVRSEPYSRHAPDFVKEELEELCAEAGIGYRWLGNHLGGRPVDPALLDAQGHPDFEAIRASTGFAAGIAELEGLARGTIVAVMCAEIDPATCHRTLLIAPELAASGHTVQHILSDGSLALLQPPLGM